MTIQSDKLLASLRNGPWLLSSVVSFQKKGRWNSFAQVARKKILNYVGDLSLLTSVWLARYMVWREMRRQRRQS